MRTTVKVDGSPIEQYGPIADLVDSTAWRRGSDWSGDLEASWTWSPPARWGASWMRRGARVEVIEQGACTWCGFLTEPGDQGDGVWQMAAVGYGAAAAGYAARDQSVPEAVGRALVDGLPYVATGYGSGPFDANTGQDPSLMLSDLLGVDSQARGRRWHVSTDRVLSYRSDPTTPRWVLAPGAHLSPTVDTEFVTHLAGRYVSAATGGQPSAWSYVYASDEIAADRFGRVERVVDLTALGLLSAASAQTKIDGRFELVGARLGYTEPFDLHIGTLLSVTSGFASPMQVRAGDMLVRSDVLDDQTTATITGGARIIAGEVRRIHAENRAEVTPVGFEPRDFDGALAAAEAPTTEAA